MKTEHGYSFNGLAIAAIAAVLVVVFVEVKQENTHWFIYLIAIGPTLLAGLLMLSKVKVDEDGIRIEYFVPLRKARVYRHEEIECYGAIKGKNGKGMASFGFLKHKDEENSIMLSGMGTKDFPVLSDFLDSIYTSGTERHNQSEQDNPITRP